MDRSLRDKLNDKIDLKTTESDVENNLDAAKIGVYLGGCISDQTANGVITTFTFTHGGAAVTNIIEGSETVIADGVQQERGAAAAYTFTGATCTVVFNEGSKPTAGKVYLNGCQKTTW